MVKPCERCRAMPPRIESGPWAGQHHLHNFCVHCSKDLCAKCLAEGKCRLSATGKHQVEAEE